MNGETAGRIYRLERRLEEWEEVVLRLVNKSTELESRLKRALNDRTQNHR
jgi:hypothetical protein